MEKAPWRWADFGREVVMYGACPRDHGGVGYYLVRDPGDDHCAGVSFDAGFQGKVRLVCGSGACPYQVDIYVDVAKHEVDWVVPLCVEDD